MYVKTALHFLRDFPFDCWFKPCPPPHHHPHNPHPPTGAPLTFTVENLGKSVLKPGFVEIGRDGGGGGSVNGKHIVLFSDTLVRGWGPITNTICYSSRHDPVKLEDFGRDGVPVQGVPYIPEGTSSIDCNGSATDRDHRKRVHRQWRRQDKSSYLASEYAAYSRRGRL